jgi:flagellar protein FliO/FliZ
MSLYTLQIIAALVFVLALIGAVGWVAKRTGLGGIARPGGKQRRVGIVEVLALDAKRRLVLVRRDGVEHLLLVSPSSDVVVERNIGGAGAGRDAAPQSFEALLEEPKPEVAA